MSLCFSITPADRSSLAITYKYHFSSQRILTMTNLDDVAMGEDNTLGNAGGATGVHNNGRVL